MSKQFHIKDRDGLYLKYKPNVDDLTEENYRSLLIEDYNFFPNSESQAIKFEFLNSEYQNSGKIIGSNSLAKSNSTNKNSIIIRNDHLIRGEMYYSSFTMFFRFFGSQNLNADNPTDFTIGDLTPESTVDYLNRLRIKLYAQIGTRLVPLQISFLREFKILVDNPVPVSPPSPTGGDIVDGGFGIQLATNDVGESCIDMAYTDSDSDIKDMFNRYTIGPDGYNFSVLVNFPDFLQKAKKTKDFKIIVKYYNLPATDGTPGYDESEITELMSENFTYQTDLNNILIKQPVFDFIIKKENFYLNAHGVSITQRDKSFTNINDGHFYILNASTKPSYFNGLYLTGIRMRDENAYPARSINMYLDKTEYDENFVYEKYFIKFNEFIVGELTIRRLLKFQNGLNTILYPFQSVKFSATYIVYNVNRLDIQYYGSSNINPDKKIGTFDISFITRSFTEKNLTNPVSENITITVNTINSGYMPLVIQEPDIDFDIDVLPGPTPSTGD